MVTRCVGSNHSNYTYSEVLWKTYIREGNSDSDSRNEHETKLLVVDC